MGIGVDLRVGEDGDFLIENGDLVLTNTIEVEVYQRIKHKLNTWTSTWWNDLTFGTPYRESILLKTTKAQVDAEFLRIIRADPQVVDILDFQTELNRNTRFYDIRFVVQAIDGTSLNFIASSDPAGSEFLYPIGSTVFPCDSTEQSVIYSNKLYKLMNFDLPPWTSDDYWGGV